MGFEYKIIAKLTKKQVSDIQYLLEENKEFDKKYVFDNKTYWDFRQLDNKGKMPNSSICFESDGIYICRYDGSDLWRNLKELKEYINRENIRYTLLDYQE